MAKKQLFENSTPHSCGGGTVFFVSRVNNHAYSKNELRHFANQGIFLSLVSTVYKTERRITFLYLSVVLSSWK